MAATSSESDALRSRAHVVNSTLAFVLSMSLKCAVELGIPAAIHRHGGPITLPELTAALSLPPSRSSHVSRLMRLLHHSGFFAGGEGGYILTPASQHLLGHGAWYPEMILSPTMLTPWLHLSSWFRDEQPPPTPLEAVHGMKLWDYARANPEFNALFNRAMSHDSELVIAQVVAKCGAALGGATTLVDVGGGNGAVARAIAAAFPHIECTVFDLPQVVEGLPASERVSFVGGNMFDGVPNGDALLIKRVLHDFNDEDCLKILKRCKEAIPAEGGKVIVIEMVMKIANQDDYAKSFQTQLFYDLLMMTVVGGKERDEQEWSNIITEAGFSSYKITPITEFFCAIEIYP